MSVDSALVYRGLDIGTAKPGIDERRRVPHHLIDLIDPAEPYSAARFVADATRAIDEIEARGALPLLVGGTMLYFKALFDGIDEMPAADPAIRAAIDEQAARLGWPALHAELARIDAPTAARLAPTDSQRIQRALEVWRISGRPLSAFHSRQAQPRAWPPLVSLEPQDRAWLHQRLARASRRCSTPGCSTRCGRCAGVPTCTPTCRRCAASATARPGRHSTPRATVRSTRLRARHSSNRPPPQRASWPSAS